SNSVELHSVSIAERLRFSKKSFVQRTFADPEPDTPIIRAKSRLPRRGGVSRPRASRHPPQSVHPQAEADQWLARHRNVHFHYTPTHGSWLNQIEVWFSILAGRSLKGASFASRSDLIAHIDSFIADYNEHADPFVWTKSAVHQKTLKPCFAVQ